MIFNVLKSSLHFSTNDQAAHSVSISFEVVPKGRDYLDIGDTYILCARNLLPLRDEKRESVGARVSISSNGSNLAHIEGERPICGYVSFHRPRRDRFDGGMAGALEILIVAKPSLVEEIIRTRITGPGTASIYVNITGLEYGWEPDRSHKVWKLDDSSDCGVASRRRVIDFWFNVETFATTEAAIQNEDDRRLNAWLAESRDPEDRKLATLNSPSKPDLASTLLRQCRTLLVDRI